MKSWPVLLPPLPPIATSSIGPQWGKKENDDGEKNAIFKLMTAALVFSFYKKVIKTVEQNTTLFLVFFC